MCWLRNSCIVYVRKTKYSARSRIFQHKSIFEIWRLILQDGHHLATNFFIDIHARVKIDAELRFPWRRNRFNSSWQQKKSRIKLCLFWVAALARFHMNGSILFDRTTEHTTCSNNKCPLLQNCNSCYIMATRLIASF